MDLKHRTITLRELLENPKSKAVLQRRFGKWMNHPLAGAAQSLTLAQLVELASKQLPRKTIQDTLQELERL